jgi:ABC-type multidrug transport system ATPase subunit
MATHTLEECEKIADRIMVLSEGSISVCDTPTALRRQFKCGYLIETEEANAEQLGTILRHHGLENTSVETAEGQAHVVISAEEHGLLGGILKDVTFQYLMSIQNLEARVVSHIQDQEMAPLHQRDSQINDDDDEHHPRV